MRHLRIGIVALCMLVFLAPALAKTSETGENWIITSRNAQGIPTENFYGITETCFYTTVENINTVYNRQFELQALMPNNFDVVSMAEWKYTNSPRRTENCQTSCNPYDEVLGNSSVLTHQNCTTTCNPQTVDDWEYRWKPTKQFMINGKSETQKTETINIGKSETKLFKTCVKMPVRETGKFDIAVYDTNDLTTVTLDPFAISDAAFCRNLTFAPNPSADGAFNLLVTEEIGGLTYTSASEVTIVDKECNDDTGNEVPRKIHSDNGTAVNASFILNTTLSVGTNVTYSVYYSRTGFGENLTGYFNETDGANKKTIGLYHFEEGTGSTSANNITDGDRGNITQISESMWELEPRLGEYSINVSTTAQNARMTGMSIPENGTIEFLFKPNINYNQGNPGGAVIIQSDQDGGGNSNYFVCRIAGSGEDGVFYCSIAGAGNEGQGRIVGSTDNFTAGKWYHIVVQYGANSALIWVNGVLEGNNTVVKPHTSPSPFLCVGGYGSHGAGLCDTNTENFDGLIDELRIYNETGIGTTHKIYGNVTLAIGEEETAPPGAVNTSLLGVNFSVDDFSFASLTFTEAFSFIFNTSGASTDIIILSTMNILKSTGGGTNEVWVNISVDGTEVLEERLRTVTKPLGPEIDEGSSGTKPVKVTLANGTHNVTYFFRRTGAGAVEINDIDINLWQFFSAHDSAIRGNLTEANFSHSTNEFTDAFSWNIGRSSVAATFYTGKFTLNATGSATASYYYKNPTDGTTSPFWRRFLSDSADIGSVSGSYIDTNLRGTNTEIIAANTTAGTVSVNGTIIDFDLEDGAGNTIVNFQASNASTDLNNSLSLGAGTHLLVRQTATPKNGTSYALIMTSSFISTSGTQTPVYYINSSELDESNCFSKKERYLSNNSDVGNVFIYLTCNNLVINTTYTFNLWVNVSAGETLTQLDESLSGFEIAPFDTTRINVAPIVAILTPEDNGNLTGTFFINASVVDQNNDPFLSNITLSNASTTIVLFSNLASNNLSVFFDSTTITEGTYNLTWNSGENQTLERLRGNDTILITIDNTLPTIFTQDTPVDEAITSDTTPFFNWTQTVDVNFRNYTLELANDSAFTIGLQAFLAGTTVGNNSHTIATSLGFGSFYWRVIAFDWAEHNRTAGNRILHILNTSQNITFDSGVRESNTSFHRVDISGATFTGAVLEWNSTQYPANLNGSSAYFNLNIPIISINNTNISFKWWLNATELAFQEELINNTQTLLVAYNITYSNISKQLILEGDIVTFSINFTNPFRENSTAVITPFLTLNNTNYTMGFVSRVNDIDMYSIDLVMPAVGAPNFNYTVNFTQRLALTFNNSWRIENQTQESLTVSKMFISNESTTAVNSTLFFNVFFENTRIPVPNVTFEVAVSVSNNNITSTFTSINIANNMTLFIFPAWASFIGNVSIIYENEDTTQRNILFFDINMSAEQQNFSLFLLNLTDSLFAELKVVDRNSLPVPNIRVSVHRLYHGNNTFDLVAQGLTSADGKITTYLVPFFVEYLFTLSAADGTFVKQETRKARTPVDLSYISEVFTIYQELESIHKIWVFFIQHDCNYENSTKILTCGINDTTASRLTNTRLIVDSNRLPNRTRLCDERANGTSAVLVCNASAITEFGATYTLYATIDGIEAIITSGQIPATTTTEFGDFGVFIAFVIVMSAALFGATFNPLAAGLFAAIGLILANALGYLSMTGTGIAAALVLFILIAIKARA